MKRFVWSAIFFIICQCSSFLYAQENQQANQLVITDQMQYEYGQSLFEKKEYDTAIIELKRLVYFFPQSHHVESSQFLIALCLFRLDKFYESAKAFNEIILKDKENNLTTQAYFYQSQAFFKIGNTGYAKIVLHNFEKLTQEVQIKDRIYFELAMIHLADAEQGKKESLALARKNLLKISSNGFEKFQTDKYLDLIVQTQNLPEKNPTTAGVMAIIPGGGFLYCERYKDAAVAFLLNAGLILAAYEAWDDGNEALAGVIGFVETGFYTGNIYGSVSSAHKHNKNQIKQMLKNRFSISPKLDPVHETYGVVLQYKF